MPEEVARLLAEDPWVEWVEEDQVTVGTVGYQTNPVWGLDRIDQVSLPLDAYYVYPVGASGIHVYVLDSGIFVNHLEFQGRASEDFTAVNDGHGAGDCHGHGTHVAGTIGAITYGVAKRAKLHSVRVLDCNNAGSVSGAVAGVDWVTAHHRSPAVANMSFEVLGGSAALDSAVQRSISVGVTYVVAAGNHAQDACLNSPSRVGPAITVAASNASDGLYSLSNYGSCVDIYAPGDQILSTHLDGGTLLRSGTSMASPHVAGVAAMYLAWRSTALPSEVANAIVAAASTNELTGVPGGSPNRLVFAPFVPACFGSLEMCSGQCTDLLSDTQNCGECGKQCQGTGLKCFDPDGSWYFAGQTCSSGACVSLPCDY